jgi:hypothetical protein
VTHAITLSRAGARGTVDTRVRIMFERTLSSWAADVLSLRRRGLDRPVWHAGGPAGRMTPGAAALGRGRA